MRSRLVLGLGLAGAIGSMLAASCGTVDLGTTPADVNACRPSRQFFYEKIWPEFLDKEYGGRRCNDSGCHAAGSARELLIVPPTSAPMLPLPADWETLYRSVTEQLLCTDVEASRLYLKPQGQLTHGGMKLIEPDGPEAKLIKMWVTAP
jgi:hypothetical protein